MSKSLKLLLAATILALLAAAYTVYTTLVAHGEEGIRLGIEFNTHATAAWIALHNHMFEKYHIPVAGVVKFRTGVELAAALKAGEVDAAWACLAPVLKMVDHGLRVYIIAAAHYHGYGCVARPGITSVNDLKKLGTIEAAVTGPGAQTHVLLLLAEKRYGFRARIRFVKPPAILELVEKGLVDLACMPEHYLSIAESRGLRVLFTSQDLWPNMPGSYLIVTEKLLREHPEIVCRLYRLNRDAIRYALQHPRQAAEIDAEYLHIPVSVAERSLSRLKLTWVLNVGEMQKLADFMYEHGLLKHRINVSRLIVDVGRLCGWEHGG